jgi:hypothetical protein
MLVIALTTTHNKNDLKAADFIVDNFIDWFFLVKERWID